MDGDWSQFSPMSRGPITTIPWDDYFYRSYFYFFFSPQPALSHTSGTYIRGGALLISKGMEEAAVQHLWDCGEIIPSIQNKSIPRPIPGEHRLPGQQTCQRTSALRRGAVGSAEAKRGHLVGVANQTTPAWAALCRRVLAGAWCCRSHTQTWGCSSALIARRDPPRCAYVFKRSGPSSFMWCAVNS